MLQQYSQVTFGRRLLIGIVLLFGLFVMVTACRRPADQEVAEQPATSTAIEVTAAVTVASTVRPTVPEPTLTESSSAPQSPPQTQPSAEHTPSSFQQFLPSVGVAEPTPQLTATPEPPPSATPTRKPTPTPIPTVDFTAARAELRAAGQDLAFVKFGFHLTFLNRPVGLDQYVRRLDEAGVPVVLKAVDNAGPLFDVQQIVRNSAVPHVLIFRSTVAGDVPDYNLPPLEAARIHWQRHRDAFPPELDRNTVWLETINEVDKQRSEWMAEFALATAEMAMAEGFRWAAFGWAAGEPEPEHWQSPAMLAFLRLAAANPERLAIALHEGSGTVENAAFEYPFRTGRFLKLFEICDAHGIPRPTVLITEWAWEFNDIPPTDRAMRDIKWAAGLYAPFPQVKGIAIWNLGSGWGDISREVVTLVEPLMIYALTSYFSVPAPPAQASTDPARYAN